MIPAKTLLKLSKVSVGLLRYLFSIRSVSLFAVYIGANF
jgi:hypothetical protein